MRIILAAALALFSFQANAADCRYVGPSGDAFVFSEDGSGSHTLADGAVQNCTFEMGTVLNVGCTSAGGDYSGYLGRFVDASATSDLAIDGKAYRCEPSQ